VDNRFLPSHKSRWQPMPPVGSCLSCCCLFLCLCSLSAPHPLSPGASVTHLLEHHKLVLSSGAPVDFVFVPVEGDKMRRVSWTVPQPSGGTPLASVDTTVPLLTGSRAQGRQCGHLPAGSALLAEGALTWFCTPPRTAACSAALTPTVPSVTGEIPASSSGSGCNFQR